MVVFTLMPFFCEIMRYLLGNIVHQFGNREWFRLRLHLLGLQLRKFKQIFHQFLQLTAAFKDDFQILPLLFFLYFPCFNNKVSA